MFVFIHKLTLVHLGQNFEDIFIGHLEFFITLLFVALNTVPNNDFFINRLSLNS